MQWLPCTAVLFPFQHTSFLNTTLTLGFIQVCLFCSLPSCDSFAPCPILTAFLCPFLSMPSMSIQLSSLGCRGTSQTTLTTDNPHKGPLLVANGCNVPNGACHQNMVLHKLRRIVDSHHTIPNVLVRDAPMGIDCIHNNALV